MSTKRGMSSERLEEIIEEIVENLPPRKGTFRTQITTAVRQVLKELRENLPWQMKLLDQAAMRAHARKLNKAATELEILLETAPGIMQALLFSDLAFSPDELPSKEKLVQEYIKRSEPFFDELDRLRKSCAQAIKKGWGTHPNYDHAKALSARSAYNLMKSYSAAKITGTRDGSFRAVTSLFYEAVSGRPDADLKRACDDVIRVYKRKGRSGTD